MPPTEILASLLILGSALVHAVVNTLIKVSADPLLVRGCMNGVALCIALLCAPFVSMPGVDLWPILALSTLIHGLYPYVLVAAYRRADLSIAYPLARGSAPLFVMLVDGWISGPAGGTQLAGAIVVSVAVASLALDPARTGRYSRASVAAALVTGLVVAAYTIVDAIGLRAAPSALTYIVWLFIMDGAFVSGTVAMARRAHIKSFLALHWRSGLLAGALGVLTYGLALFALRLGTPASIAALRETSILFAAAIAALHLREPFGMQRAAATAAVVVGIALMHWPQ